MVFPKEFIEDVKRSTDMVALAGEYTELYPMGTGIWGGKCPHPAHDDSTPSFRVIEESNSWFCGGCHSGTKGGDNYGSDSIAFMMWLKGMTFYSAVKYLVEKLGMALPSDANQKLYDMNKARAHSYMKSVQNIMPYLKERGLDGSDIKKWLIGYNGKLNFPLIDEYNRIIGFTNRSLDGSHPKYKNSKNSEIFNKGSFLYGINIIDRDFEEIRIAEGPMDVILSTKYGARNVVASLGTAFTESHVATIKRLKKIPVFCMDGDSAGFDSAEKAMHLLARNDIYSKVLILPPKKDMADMSLELEYDIESYIEENSVTFGQYKVQGVVNKYEAKMNEIILKLYPEFEEALNSVKHYNEKKLLKSYIEKKTGVAF